MERKLFIGLVLVASFVMVVSIASLYVQSHIMSGTVCGCEFPIELMVPLLSSSGLLIGSLTYYFLGNYINPQKFDPDPILNLLPADERTVLKSIAESGGKMTQARLVEKSGMNKVKVSRLISDLETRGAVTKKSHGMTNEVELTPPLAKMLND